MLVAGWFTDASSGSPVKGASISVVDNNASSLGISTVSDDLGFFDLDYSILAPGNNIWLYVTRAGYEPVLIQPVFDGGQEYKLDQSGSSGSANVPAPAATAKKNNWLPWLLIGGGAMVLSSSTAKKKSVGKIDAGTQQILLYVGGGAVLYFGIISPILKKLGLQDSQAVEDLHDASQVKGNAWDPTTWQACGAGALIMTQAAAIAMAATINDSFDLMSADYAAIKGVFTQLKSQSQVSFLAYTYNQMYNKDLLADLTAFSWTSTHLSMNQAAEINTYVSKLPKCNG